MSPGLVKAGLWTLERGPMWLAQTLAKCYVHAAEFAMPEWRRVAESNFERTGVSGGQEILSGLRRGLARGLALFARIPRLTPERLAEWLVIDGLDRYHEAHRRNRGVIFVSGHLGNWELTAIALGWICPPVLVVIRPHTDPGINEILSRRRSQSGNVLVAEDKSARAVVRALQKNGNVCIADDLPPRSGRGVWIDFLCAPARTSTAVARMAALTGAAVVPVLPIWSEKQRRYTVRLLEPMIMTGDRIEDTRRIHRAIENGARECPEQWLWILDRWAAPAAGAVLENQRHAPSATAR